MNTPEKVEQLVPPEAVAAALRVCLGYPPDEPVDIGWPEGGKVHDALQAAYPILRKQIEDELRERIKVELVSDGWGHLSGPLGEAIANASGNYSLEFNTPQEVAEGVCEWLGAGGDHA